MKQKGMMRYRWAVSRYIDAKGWHTNGTKLRSGRHIIDLIRQHDERGYKTCSIGLVGDGSSGNVLKIGHDLFIKRYCTLRTVPVANSMGYVNVLNATQPASKYTSDSFLSSAEWRKTRMLVIKRDGARCVCCGATPATGATITVDHIKPRRLFPELALDMDNLQVLCWPCNEGKGNWDQTDWR